MPISALRGRLNAAVLSRAAGFGEQMTFTRAGADTGLAVVAAIMRRSSPIWGGGMVVVDEEHITGYVIGSSFSAPPSVGDVMTSADGIRYEIDQEPVFDNGLWRLVLRVRT